MRSRNRKVIGIDRNGLRNAMSNQPALQASAEVMKKQGTLTLATRDTHDLKELIVICWHA